MDVKDNRNISVQSRSYNCRLLTKVLKQIPGNDNFYLSFYDVFPQNQEGLFV